MEKRPFSFEKLHVWVDIRNMIKEIYTITSAFPENEKYCLVNQMRRAAISISSNLAEGAARTSFKDQAHFYQLSYSSLMELLSQLIVCNDLGLISEDQYLGIKKQIDFISFKLNALRKSTLKILSYSGNSEK
ncbi:MAG TPA: four helix bundle protein [Bacteroidales bacterium]|nr:four helix bundle protein [Bacteroidales bacterium]HRZ47805.1 four helix bundle protein [Bacteroidales bacterium]